MLRILLTGSNGFLASRFFDYYKDKYVLIPINKKSLDLTNEKDVLNLFKRETIDLVFHTAAISDIYTCECNPVLAQKTNTNASINIAKGCTYKNSVLVFASSDQVYRGGLCDNPYSEEDITMASNLYAKSKLTAEREIATITDRYYHLRLTWMFSYLERNKKTNNNIITNIMKSIFNKSPIALSDNTIRSMTYVYEVIENFEKIIQLPYGVYNTGSENNLSNYDVGLKILEYMNLSHRAHDIILKETHQDKSTDLRIANKKLKDYGIDFSSTEDGLKRCIEEFKLRF